MIRRLTSAQPNLLRRVGRISKVVSDSYHRNRFFEREVLRGKFDYLRTVEGLRALRDKHAEELNELRESHEGLKELVNERVGKAGNNGEVRARIVELVAKSRADLEGTFVIPKIYARLAEIADTEIRRLSQNGMVKSKVIDGMTAARRGERHKSAKILNCEKPVIAELEKLEEKARAAEKSGAIGPNDLKLMADTIKIVRSSVESGAIYVRIDEAIQRYSECETEAEKIILASERAKKLKINADALAFVDLYNRKREIVDELNRQAKALGASGKKELSGAQLATLHRRLQALTIESFPSRELSSAMKYIEGLKSNGNGAGK